MSPLQLFIEAVRRQRTCLSLLGALFKAAVDAYTSTVGSVPSRDDAVVAPGTPFETDDGTGSQAAPMGLDGDPNYRFG